ncbi:MAG: T9SS type A sorting domain-containing protein [Candidatus Eisenbacteria bacterium]|nr:T9SS type A sorting domain-containing protein [Candidatus Eisenbacteria bacterium]
MAMVRAKTSLCSLFLSAVVAGMLFLVVSVLWVTAEGAASATEPAPTLSEKRDGGTVQLPGSMDPMDVVRMVERNRVRVGGRHSVSELDRDSSAVLHGDVHYERDYFDYGGESFAGAPVRGALPLSVDGKSQAAGRLASADEVGSPFLIGRGEPMYGPAANDQCYPAVAFDGTNYLVVWEDDRSGTYSDIYGARVSAGGSVLDTTGIAISTAPIDQLNPAVAFDGTNYLVVWMDNRSRSSWDIYGARVSVGGSVLDPGGIAVATGTTNQYNPAIGFDGTNCLVVWMDYGSGSGYDIYGARVSTNGSVLDPGSIAISTAANSQEFPAIAFDGTDFLVVWEDGRSGTYSDIYGARVSAGGSVLDPGGVAISTAALNQFRPRIAFDGTNFLVVWHDSRNGPYYDVYGVRVSAGGSVLDTADIAISTAAMDQLYPAIAFDGTNYLVVWMDDRSRTSWDSYGARVSTDGSVLDPGGIAVATSPGDQFSPAIAFDGTNFLVVWHDYRSGSRDIYGTRMSAGGSVLDAAGIAISTAANNQFYPAIASDGTDFLVVWEDNRGRSYDIYGARVSGGGSVLDPGGIAISTGARTERGPAVAFDGTSYLVVWHDYRSGTYSDIYGARVGTDGSVLDPGGIAISTATNYQFNPAVAFDGTNCLVVWEDWRNYYSGWDDPVYPDIYGARVSVDGSVLDPGGIAISTGAYEKWCPAIAFDGTNYLVVWEDNRSSGYSDIYGARVGMDGSVLDPDGIAISTAAHIQYLPAVASDGTDYLVVWDDRRNVTESYPFHDIYGARVSAGGSVLDTAGIGIATGTNDQRRPAIAFDETNYLVVWEDYYSGSGSGYEIYGARVLPAGTVLDPAGFAISAGAYDQLRPALASGTSSGMMISYQSFTPAPTYGSYRIWGNAWNGPVDIAFASASATAEQGHVTLSWQMAVEAVTSSFRIERSESLEGEFLTLDLPISMSSGFKFSCTDCSVQPGKTYWYRIVLVGSSWEESYGPVEVRVGAVPTAYRAHQSYPNPFNPLCTIGYDVPRAGKVSLQVFDVTGSLVRILVNGWREPGEYSEAWNGRADDGSASPSGVYFYRLKAGDFVATRKMVLMR